MSLYLILALSRTGGGASSSNYHPGPGFCMKMTIRLSFEDLL